MAENDLIQTGLKGFDAVLLGGIPRGNIILVQGETGTGKTLLGMEFIYRGIAVSMSPASSWYLKPAPRNWCAMREAMGWDFRAVTGAEEAPDRFYHRGGARTGSCARPTAC